MSFSLSFSISVSITQQRNNSMSQHIFAFLLFVSTYRRIQANRSQGSVILSSSCALFESLFVKFSSTMRCSMFKAKATEDEQRRKMKTTTAKVVIESGNGFLYESYLTQANIIAWRIAFRRDSSLKCDIKSHIISPSLVFLLRKRKQE